jgi:hypothetical protein
MTDSSRSQQRRDPAQPRDEQGQFTEETGTESDERNRGRRSVADDRRSTRGTLLHRVMNRASSAKKARRARVSKARAVNSANGADLHGSLGLRLIASCTPH